MLAGQGFTVISVNYSIAPGARYPVPVRQVNAALGFLAANASRLHVDPQRLFLAGDSAGSHIAAQVANAISVPSYAPMLDVRPAISHEQLRGMLLFCGAYEIHAVKLDGPFGGFLRTVLWAYSGSREFQSDEHFASAAVIDYVDAKFPPSFISAGNVDPLLCQSTAFAARLGARGVEVDSLFFPDNYQPPLAHEYQFDLDGEAGKLARAVAFLRLHAN